MATPTAPTTTSILTEAFARCSFPSPTAQQMARAEAEWLEEAKRELATEKRWRNLEETIVMIPQAGIQAYPVPSPFYRILRMRLYDGGTKGTGAGGGTNTITVATGTGDVNTIGRKIFLTGGTGAAQSNRIMGVSGDVLTVACAWVTIPDTTTTYLIADFEWELIGPEPIVGRTGLGMSRPRNWEEDAQTIRLWPVPDLSTYALELDGIIDISLLDTDDSRWTKLAREWRIYLLYAVMSKISDDNDDDENAQKYEARAQQAKVRLMREDSRRVLGKRAAAFRTIGGIPARR